MSNNIKLTFDCLRFDGTPRFIYRKEDGELKILDVELGHVNFSNDSEVLCIDGDLPKEICKELLEADSITIDSGGLVKASLLELLKYVTNMMAVMTSILCLATNTTVSLDNHKTQRRVKLIFQVFKD